MQQDQKLSLALTNFLSLNQERGFSDKNSDMLLHSLYFSITKKQIKIDTEKKQRKFEIKELQTQQTNYQNAYQDLIGLLQTQTRQVQNARFFLNEQQTKEQKLITLITKQKKAIEDLQQQIRTLIIPKPTVLVYKNKVPPPIVGILAYSFGTIPFRGALPLTGILMRYTKTQDVQAIRSGIVVLHEEKSSSLGNYVVIQHKDNTLSVYANLATIRVKKNSDVSDRQIIGTVQATNEKQELLFFAMMQDGKFIDPKNHLSL